MRKSCKSAVFLQTITEQLVDKEIPRRIARGLQQSTKHALQLIGYSLAHSHESSMLTTCTRAVKRKRCHVYPKNNDKKNPPVCNQNIWSAHSFSVKPTVLASNYV